MSRSILLVNDSGWLDDYTISSAARYVANEGSDSDARFEAVAEMIAAILETMPSEEVLRILNAGSRRVWKIAE